MSRLLSHVRKAVVVVHWPGKSVYACRHHADALQRIATGMGMPPVTETPTDDPDRDCGNCVNEEAKR